MQMSRPLHDEIRGRTIWDPVNLLKDPRPFCRGTAEEAGVFGFGHAIAVARHRFEFNPIHHPPWDLLDKCRLTDDISDKLAVA